MRKSIIYKVLMIIGFLIAGMTLGGLGNAASTVSHVYWVPFVINIPVYAGLIYGTFKAAKMAEKDEREAK